MLELRDYQAAAIAAAYGWQREHKTPCCIVLPTGAGKTPVLCTIANDCARHGKRVLIVSHVKELIEQAAGSMRRWFKDIPTTVYSAGIGTKDLSGQVVVGGVQSLCKAKHLGLFDVVLVDEAHCIPPKKTSQYKTLLEHVRQGSEGYRLIGLTATPYRLDGGLIYGDEKLFAGVCYEAGVADLIERGYLSNLSSKRGTIEADLSKVTKKRGEFDAAEMEHEFDLITAEAVKDVLRHSRKASSVLLFCSGVNHAYSVKTLIEARGEICEVITGSTPKELRESIVERFKSGELKYLANVNVLTTGFDATRVDLVCLLRATLSPGLFYQMVGRGLRLHEGKTCCTVLDFGKNIDRHGCIDAIKPPPGMKHWTCLICSEVNPPMADDCRCCGNHWDQWKCQRCEEPNKSEEKECIRCKLKRGWICCVNCEDWHDPKECVCPHCGHVRPQQIREPKIDNRAADLPILSKDNKGQLHPIDSVDYFLHYKGRDSSTTPTLRVSYMQGLRMIAQEWVCIEHAGFAGNKAREWWRMRTDEQFPKTVEDAIDIARAGSLREPEAIETRRGQSGYTEITRQILRD
jgi:DNA repair protein RadD